METRDPVPLLRPGCRKAFSRSNALSTSRRCSTRNGFPHPIQNEGAGMYGLNGRVRLVTGGRSGGIGREIARRLARKGMTIAVLNRFRDPGVGEVDTLGASPCRSCATPAACRRTGAGSASG
jgi:hypothetical protein